MPKRSNLNSILILGSGPIIIGQACEFDYSGTQAAKALKSKGIRVILLNSNPATIMTDPEIAHATYIEPLTVEVVEKIILKEKPDAILPTVGGQTGLNLALECFNSGILEKYNVELIGAKIEAIKKAEDRELFKKAMEKIGLKVARSELAKNLSEALEIKKRIGLPLIIRPAFTLGGTGGGIAKTEEEFLEAAQKGINASPINQILVEESLLGWKEFELEVVRDLADNVVIICSIENLDPMGIHTGDSITVAPQQTLSDKEYQNLRDMSIKIIREIGVETGGSNIQYAVNPKNGDVIVIEMNPRVSRSSALASKATGFPIAKIAALLSIGYTLDEISNDITKVTKAAFEPSIDYVVTKIPRFSFEKFPGTSDELGVQMKSVGESMAIGRTFKESFQKAIRSLEKGRFGLGNDGYFPELIALENKSKIEKIEFIKNKLSYRNENRVYFAKIGFDLDLSLEEIYKLTNIDPWFLHQIKEISNAGKLYASNQLSILEMKKLGFSNQQIGYLESKTEIEQITQSSESNFSKKSMIENILREKEFFVQTKLEENNIFPTFKRIDTCAGEFEAHTPYLYSTYEDEDETNRTNKDSVLIIGSGPNRIGQGIEFDYCCCHASFALQELGIESIIVNSNPETVSTDYDSSDRLYFEPITLENVTNIYKNEKPLGVIVQFGGQTPLKLINDLKRNGIKILGTSPESVDQAEDRNQFNLILKKLNLRAPKNSIARNENEAIINARSIGYPILVRPSYVIGGRAMAILSEEKDLITYLKNTEEISENRPLLIDMFLEDAIEFDIDALSDGEEVKIAGILEHIEEAGIHSGDSACVFPHQNISENLIIEMKQITEKLAKELKIIGLINIQLAIKNNLIYILEVNPRASRTIPFISKALGIPFVKLATKIILGKKIREFGLPHELKPKLIQVKEVALPFNKFPEADTILGPEMRSTGEVMGIAETFGEAFMKSQVMVGDLPPRQGSVFVSISDKSKDVLLDSVNKLFKMGYTIIATSGTHKFLSNAGILSFCIGKVHEESFPSILDFIKSNKIHLIINTANNRESKDDSYLIRQSAIKYKIPCLTTVNATKSFVQGLEEMRNKGFQIKPLQEIYSI